MMKVAETRLKKRSHRPDVEACNDPPHNRLLDEVSTITDSILLLDQKITEAEVLYNFKQCR
jgi:Tektin family